MGSTEGKIYVNIISVSKVENDRYERKGKKKSLKQKTIDELPFQIRKFKI